jgi:hypothetical protein
VVGETGRERERGRLKEQGESRHVKKKLFPPYKNCTGENVFYARPCCKDLRERGGLAPVRLRPERTASQGLSLNRSQYGGCSTKYNTPAGTQVVCRRFEGEQVVLPKSPQKELAPEQ